MSSWTSASSITDPSGHSLYWKSSKKLMSFLLNNEPLKIAPERRQSRRLRADIQLSDLCAPSLDLHGAVLHASPIGEQNSRPRLLSGHDRARISRYGLASQIGRASCRE